MKIRINEAISAFNKIQKAQNILNDKPLHHGKITKHYLAALLWPESRPKTQGVNMSNLIHGRTETIRLEWLEILCRELNVTLDTMLDYHKTILK